MPDQTCVHLSPIGNWCRLKNNFKCPAQKGRIGCPMPNVVNLEERISERLERQENTMVAQHQAFAQLSMPFPASEIEFKIETISKDRRRALVRPVLPARAVIDRLDAVLGEKEPQRPPAPQLGPRARRGTDPRRADARNGAQRRTRVAVHDVQDVRLEEIPEPTPGDADVIIEVAACGICGSDLEYYYGRSPVGLPVPKALKGEVKPENEEKFNRLLQEIAWETVTSQPMTGVKK